MVVNQLDEKKLFGKCFVVYEIIYSLTIKFCDINFVAFSASARVIQVI